MASQKKIMKVFVLIIIAVFLLSSGLVSVMYFVDMSSAEQPVDAVLETVDTDGVDTVEVDDILQNTGSEDLGTGNIE